METVPCFRPYRHSGIKARPTLDFQRLECDKVEMRIPLKTDNLVLHYEVGEGTLCVFWKCLVLPPFTSFDLGKSSPASLIKAIMNALVNLYSALKAL